MTSYLWGIVTSPSPLHPDTCAWLWTRCSLLLLWFTSWFPYCPFHKHATSTQANDYYEVRFSLLSIIIMATAYEPRKTETNKRDPNLPITTDQRDLLTRLKWAAVSWEVRLDDWQQQKTNFVVTVDLNKGRVWRHNAPGGDIIIIQK